MKAQLFVLTVSAILTVSGVAEACQQKDTETPNVLKVSQRQDQEHQKPKHHKDQADCESVSKADHVCTPVEAPVVVTPPVTPTVPVETAPTPAAPAPQPVAVVAPVGFGPCVGCKDD